MALAPASPSGASGSGIFGTNRVFASSTDSIWRSSASSDVMRDPNSRRAAVVASGNPPFALAVTASALAASLRSALS